MGYPERRGIKKNLEAEPAGCLDRNAQGGSETKFFPCCLGLGFLIWGS